MENRLILCTGDSLYLENVVVTTRYLGFQIMEVKRVRASTNIWSRKCECNLAKKYNPELHWKELLEFRGWRNSANPLQKRKPGCAECGRLTGGKNQLRSSWAKRKTHSHPASPLEEVSNQPWKKIWSRSGKPLTHLSGYCMRGFRITPVPVIFLHLLHELAVKKRLSNHIAGSVSTGKAPHTLIQA